MTPKAQIWRDRLNCNVAKIDDIFEASLERAQKHMNEEALIAWLKGADKVCALGRGTELVLIFLDEMPRVVQYSDPDILCEVAELAAHLSSEAVRGSINPFLATLPAIAKQLDNGASLRRWLRIIKKMVEQAKIGVKPLLEHAPYLFAQLSIDGVENWINYGIRAYSEHAHRLPDFFAIQSADAKAMLVKERNGTLFIEVKRHLQMFQHALFEQDSELLSYSLAFDTMRKPRPHIDRMGMHLPDVYEDLGSVKAIDRYLAMIAHMAAHKKYSTPFLADNFSVFQHIAIETFEDARIEYLAMQQYPGLRALWVSLHPMPKPNSCPKGWSCIRHHLAMISYAILNPNHNYSDPALLEYVEKFQLAIKTNPHDRQLSVDLGVGWLKDNHEHDFRQHKVWFENTEVSYRDDNRYLWHFLEEAEEEEDFHSDHGARMRNQDEAEDGLLTPRFYHEWDYQLQSYRPDWVTIYESFQKQGDAKKIEQLLEKHQRLTKQLKQIVDLLKPQQRRRLRYQVEGDELDIDMAIKAAIDYRIGTTPDIKIHQSHVKDGRDIAVLLLLDLSQSVNDTPKGASSTILQLSQEATAVLASAVEALGDPLAIAGFSSNTRHEVCYSHFKSFSEEWGSKTKARLAGATAAHSTRLGSALRHAGSYLEQRGEEKRLLLVLTDGEPHDIDVYDPKYLQKDTQQAVAELNSKGVFTYCISLDPKADDYVADIFGQNNFTVIDRVESLPEKLPRLFMNLTK